MSEVDHGGQAGASDDRARGWARLGWLAVLLPVYAALLVVPGTLLMGVFIAPPFVVEHPIDWLQGLFEMMEDVEYLFSAWVTALIIGATQLVFLVPIVRRRPPTGDRPKSLAVSLVVGAAVAAFLTTALMFAVLELGASIVTGQWFDNPWSDEMTSEVWAGALVLMTLLASWGFWSFVLLVLGREIWPDRAAGKLLRFLFAGTLIELILIIPIDVMVRRRTDCYCATGTFWSLAIAGLGVIWMTGPGLYLLATRRPRKRWRAAWCGTCGHAKGPSPGDVCPECGNAWA